MLDLKFFRFFFDSTKGWFPSCWTWKIFAFSIWFLECLTPRDADFHRVGLEFFLDFQFDFWSVWLHERLISTVLDLKKFQIFNLIFGVYDATRGWFPPCWTRKISNFQFDFWNLWCHERLISTMLDSKKFRNLNLIFGVFDATRGWFPLCWTWKAFVFSICFFGVFDSTRGWFPPCWT